MPPRYNPSTAVVGLEGTRRALRAISKDAGKEFDKAAKRSAFKVRDRARERMPKKTGRSAKTITVASTYQGIAVRSRSPVVRQHEWGARLWLNRGYPFARPTSGGMPESVRTAVGNLPLRTVSAKPARSGQARVRIQGQYLIKRKRMLYSAADELAPVLQRETEALMARLAAQNGF